MELIGAKLKKIRLEKGLTLEEAHRQTKIHLSILNAMEEGSVAHINPAYLKGFVKLYCQFLGIDSREFLAEPRRSVSAAPVSEPRRQASKPISFIPSASEKLRASASARPVKMPPVAVILAALIVIAVVVMAVFAFSHGRRHASRTVSSRQESKAAPRDPVRPVTVTPQVIPTGFAPAASGVRLSVSAREDCWIKVRTDGKLLYYGILKKGRSNSWQGKEKIQLNIGNAGVVDLNVNGQVITSLGRRGQAISDILITREGLTVQR